MCGEEAGRSEAQADAPGDVPGGADSLAEGRGGVDSDWVVERLREVAERCMQAVPPPAPKAGADPAPGVWKFDAGSAIRALNLLGKQMGMFSDKVEHQVSVHEDALEELE